MASKYVKGLEDSVAKKHVGNKYNDRVQKILSSEPSFYKGPKGKPPGHMLNAKAIRKTGKRPSQVLYERAAKNEAAANLIRSSFSDIKKYGDGESGFKGYTGGMRSKVAQKLMDKSSRQQQTGNVLKVRGF